MSNFISFIKLVVKNGISFRNLGHLLIHLFLKLISVPLNLIEQLIYDKKISRHQIIHPPIFIIGHWRTGTSFLHQLMAQDERFGYLNYYQAVFFGSFLLTESFLKPLLQFIANLFQSKVPFFNNTPFDWNLPCEEDTALLNTNGNYSAYLAYIFPKNAKYWFNKNMFMTNYSKEQICNWSTNYVKILKKISYKNNGRQLLLKTPPNLARIPLLIKLFPNAKFIFIDRHPKEVFRSHLKLWQSNIRHFSVQSIDDKKLQGLILDSYDKLMGKFKKDQKLINSNMLFEIYYEDLIEYPFQIINNIYTKLKLPNFHSLRQTLESYLENNSTYKPFTYKTEPRIDKNGTLILTYYSKRFKHKKDTRFHNTVC